jgi:predicted RNA-binding Zn-ribbon protein involved in translation (DUF1610 family)
MNAFLPLLFFFFYLVLITGVFAKRYDCPDCGTPLPWVVLKKNVRQWLEGGWVCPNCGIDVDSNGRKVEMPWAVSRASIGLLVAVLVLSGCPAIYLVWTMLHND